MDAGGSEETLPNDGIIFGPKAEKRKCSTKDRPLIFWASYEQIKIITKLKALNARWGANKILTQIRANNPTGLDFGSERIVHKRLEHYFFDAESDSVFFKSHDNSVNHRQCLSKDELIDYIQKDHQKDHRKSRAIYESLRKAYYPVTKENIELLFKENVRCTECAQAADLPKTEPTRRPIPATYANSRWQIDLKKMPMQNGYNYILNIVDCFSRFAFGCAVKTKCAKEISESLLKFIYLYGAPRILQSDNGKEFNNYDLAAVIQEFKIKKMNGRPYHPQSQGRVERFNRTVVAFFSKTIYREEKWHDQLPSFYYEYNNRVKQSY